MQRIHRLDSIDHPQLDPFRGLDRSNRTRDDDHFIGEGRLVVQRMLASDYPIVSVVLGEHVDPALQDLVPDSADLIQLPKAEMSKLVGFDFHSGVLACARRRKVTGLNPASDWLKKESATVVVCPFTVLPDNLGSIVRLCAGFGVDALVVGKRSADPFSRRAMRVSMGNVFQVPVIEPESTVDLLEQLRHNFGFCLLAATGSENGDSLPMQRPGERLAIVVGNEANGLEEELLACCDSEISIPMSGGTDSLNVANAVAIMLYQFTRVGIGAS